MYDTAKQYEQNGLLKSTKQDDYELFCYTQDCFFGNNDNWDEVTKSHRGQLYYKGKQVNKPFPKIFNLNEHPSTSYEVMKDLIENDHFYRVYDKANGHLFIASCFLDEENYIHEVYHTKASFPHDDNELLNKDIEIFQKDYFYEGFRRFIDTITDSTFAVTMMFEAIVEHDPHTMYEQQKEVYGENTFVLLGINYYDDEEGEWKEFHYDRLDSISSYFGLKFPIIKRYSMDAMSVHNWFDHENREGYVLHFPYDDLRIKVKTKDYWAARFKKDLSPERILQLLNGGGILRIEHRLPEELACEIKEALKEVFSVWYDEYHNRAKLLKQIADSPCSNKEVSQSGELEDWEKQYIFCKRSGRDDPEIHLNSKAMRRTFIDDLIKGAGQFYLIDLEYKLKEIVENKLQ